MLNIRDFWGRLDDHLGRKVDSSSVGWVRLVVGFTLLLELTLAWTQGEITARYVNPGFYFKYPFFPFIQKMPGYVPYGIFTLITLLTFALFLGWQTRWTAKLLAPLFCFVFLQDVTLYADHFYLTVLFLILLAWIPVNRWFSSDRLTGRETQTTLPYWCLWLLKFQVSLILIFSGTNKFTSDWLQGAPIAEWLTVEGGNWGQLDWLRQHPLLPPTLGWASALFETFAGLLLWSPLGAKLFVPLLIGYYAVDSFGIGMGVSPLIGLLSVVFLSPSLPRQVFDRLVVPTASLPGLKGIWRILCGLGTFGDRIIGWFDETPVVGKKTIVPVAETNTRESERWLVSEWTKYGIILWMLIQTMVPLRWVAYSRSKDWAEYTSRFSWRGSIRDKSGRVSLTITSTKQELRWNIDPEGEFPIPLAILFNQQDLVSRGLSEGMLRDIVGTPEELIDQRINGLGFTEESLAFLFEAHERLLDLQLPPGSGELMASEPELVRQYAHEVARVVNEITQDQVEIHAHVEESLNSRPFKTCLPASVDLTTVSNAAALWKSIQPLTEPLPSLEQRMAGARMVLAQRQLEKEMELRTMGLTRPPEPKKSPAISEESDRLLEAEFAKLLGN